MSVVISDTGPVHYLILIEEVSILPVLFEQVVIPFTVRTEMLAMKTLDIVRRWIANPPSWLQVVSDPTQEKGDPNVQDLDDGERSVLQLAIVLRAKLVLMDDRPGVLAAKRNGLLVMGTLGILDTAAARGLVDLEASLQRLIATNFRYSQRLIDHLLKSYRRIN